MKRKFINHGIPSETSRMTKTEAQTRTELIDKCLAVSGWEVKDPTQVIEEFDIFTPLPEGVSEPRTPYEGHQFSDYVLLGKDGKPLAVIEAKKTSKDAALGREQAKQYCYNILKQLGGELPFCFYTNGHDIYFWDLDNYPPRKVIGFPSREDLERFQYIRRNRKPLTQELINTDTASRDYQIRAIRSVLEGIEQKKRDFLLVMATGTGKTRTCIALADVLIRARHAEKTLFLVDRIALRELAVRLVSLRLDKIEKAVDLENTELAHREIAKLRQQISELPSSSVIIKEAASALARLDDENFWISLNHQRLEFLRSEIKPLFRTVSEADFKAMRFERDLLEYSVAVLNGEQSKAETLKDGIVEQISDLPLSINFVNAENDLIRAAQTAHYWSHNVALSLEDVLDELNSRLGPLMQFREQQTNSDQVHLDLIDELHRKEKVEFGPQHESVSISRYREMVETMIVELTAHNPILQKIQNGLAVSGIEAAELAEMLHAEHPHITENLLHQVYKNRKAHFIQFIRHILDIEILKSFPDTVSDAFEQFIQQHNNLTSRQLEFLNLLKGFITERERVEKRDHINAPFTVIHPQGIRGVFNPSEINEILQLTERLAA
ncbi:MAG: type I site-specific restriction endonuclease [Parasphingorhabdus sp.]|jgi:type I site-specific restriction endonuclease